MSIEIVKRKLEIKYGGESFEVLYPTALQLAKYQKMMKEKEDDSILITIDLLVNLGLKKEVAEILEIEDMTMIVEKFSEKKR